MRLFFAYVELIYALGGGLILPVFPLGTAALIQAQRHRRFWPWCAAGGAWALMVIAAMCTQYPIRSMPLVMLGVLAVAVLVYYPLIRHALRREERKPSAVLIVVLVIMCVGSAAVLVKPLSFALSLALDGLIKLLLG